MEKENVKDSVAARSRRRGEWLASWGFLLALFGAWGLGWEAVAIAAGASCLLLGLTLYLASRADELCTVEVKLSERPESVDQAAPAEQSGVEHGTDWAARKLAELNARREEKAIAQAAELERKAVAEGKRVIYPHRNGGPASVRNQRRPSSR